MAVHAEINDMMKRHFGRVPRRWLVNYAYACVEAEGDSAMPKKLRVAAEYLRARRRWAR